MAQAKHVTTAIPSQITDAISKSSVGGLRAAHARFVADLAGQLPRPIPLIPTPADFEHRAEYLNRVLEAVSMYVTHVLEDTAENVSGGLDLRDIQAAFSDLGSDVRGKIQ